MSKDVFTIPLGGGIDLKTDPKAVQIGKFLSMQNCVFDTSGSLKKRNGNLKLPTTNQNSNTVNGFSGLATLNDQLLALGTDDNLYTPLLDQNLLSSQGTMQPMRVATMPTASTNNGSNLFLSSTASAILASPVSTLPTPQGIQVTAWENPTSGIYYQVTDLYSGAVVVTPTLLASGGYSPRCFTVGNTVVVFYANVGGLIIAKVIAAATPTAITTHSLGVGDIIGTLIYDITYNAADNAFWIVWYDGSNPKILKIGAASFSVILAATTIPGMTDSFLGSFGVIAPYIGQCVVFMAGSNASSTIRLNYAVVVNAGTSPSNGVSGSVVAAASPVAGPIAIANISTHVTIPSGNLTVMLQTADTGTKVSAWGFTYSLITSAFTNSGTAIYEQRGLYLHSTFLPATSLPNLVLASGSYGIVSWQSSLQATYFVVDQNFRIHGKFLAGQAGANPSSVRDILTDFNVNAAGGICNVSLPVQNAITAVNGSILTTNAVQFCAVNFIPLPSFTKAQLGQNVHMTGGHLWQYDGATLCENGFHIYPEGITADAPVVNVQQSQPAQGAGGQIVTQLTFPPASQIANGSFIQIMDQPASHSASGFDHNILFQLNGATPSLPFSTAGALIKVPLLSTDSSSVVAQKVYQAAVNTPFGIAPLLNLGQSQVTFTGTVTAGATAALVAAARNSQEFSIFQTYPSDGTNGGIVVIEAPAAAYLAPGQFFVIQSNLQTSSANTSIAVWFQIGGSGSAPSSPVYNGGTIQVTLTGTESPSGVATALVSAINGAIFSANVVSSHTNLVKLADQTAAANGAVGGYNVSAGGLLQRTAGTTTAGVYGYAVSYRWTDRANQVNQSSPSPLLVVNIGPNQAAQNSVACGSSILTVPYLRVTDKTNVQVDIWRTLVNAPGVLYRLTSSAIPIQNDPTKDSFTYQDTKADSALVGSDLLYTVGQLPNAAPPSCASVIVHQNRLFVAGQDNPLIVWPSQKFQPGQGVAFSNQLFLQLDPEGGPITALASLDDKVVVFKESQIWAFNGDGPDPLGLTGAWSPPQFIVSGDTGCLGPSLVAELPVGLAYVSAKGLYLLDRQLNATFFGAPLAGVLNTDQAVSMFTVESQNQLRVLTKSGVTFVYDYFEQQWGTFTPQSGYDGINWHGVAVYSDSVTNQLYMENPGSWQDGTTPFQYQFETPWVDETGKRQGFQRIFKGLWEGLFQLGQSVTIEIQYDGDTSYKDPIVYTAAYQLDANWYGAVPYGAGQYGGSAGNDTTQPTNPEPIVEFRMNPPRHRCRRIKFNVYETTPTNNPLEFTTLTLEVGTGTGAWRIGNNNVAG